MPIQSLRIYRTGKVGIDTGLRIVTRDGQPVPLRSRSFNLLIYLIERRGTIVSKDELFGSIWKDTSVTDNALVQSLRDIRLALADDPRQPTFIRTVPRSGYCFIADVDDVTTAAVAQVVLPAEPPRPSALRVHGIWLALALALPMIAAALLVWRAPSAETRAEAAWWKFNEGNGTRVRDSGPNHLAGALAGAPHWTEGKLGSGLSFDGLTNFIQGADGRKLPLGTTPRTIAAWIRPSTTVVDNVGILQYGADRQVPYPDSFMLVFTRQGTISLGNYSSGITGRIAVGDNRWHHVLGTWDGGVARIYVDGVQDTEGKVAYQTNTESRADWSIGRFLRYGTPFRGVIDDVRVYSRALTPQEVEALYRCSLGAADISLRGKPHYFMPVFYDGLVIDPGNSEIRNGGRDLSGIQFARSDGSCGVESLRGADVGQDLQIRMEVLVPKDAAGHKTAAGPYFHSKSARPGDGIIGGSSAGYLVQLDAEGMIKVRRLQPHAIIAFSAPPDRFDSTAFHRLEAVARGERLSVKLDGIERAFDQGGTISPIVAIPPAWKTSTPVGYNEGTAGVAFLTEDRRQIGGQRARNIVISPL